MADERIQESSSTEGRQQNAGEKLYNLIIIILDIVWMLIKWTVYTVESIYYLIVKPAPKDVQDDIVLVTGAGHGIGKQVAIKYAQLGATVVCLDINEKGNNETVDEIKAMKGNAFGFACDVSSRAQIVEVGQKIKERVGTVTVIINNAGIMPTHPLLQHTEGEIRKIFDINVLAHFWILQTYIPGMIEKNRGHIVCLSSVAGLCGLNNLVPYCASKFAVRGIMEAMFEELRADPRGLNIKFTSIYPYMVDTGLCKKPKMRFENAMRLVTPAEAADAIIDAQRRGLLEQSIPTYLQYLNCYTRLFPLKAANLLRDFLGSGVESDLS